MRPLIDKKSSVFSFDRRLAISLRAEFYAAAAETLSVEQLSLAAAAEENPRSICKRRRIIIQPKDDDDNGFRFLHEQTSAITKSRTMPESWRPMRGRLSRAEQRKARRSKPRIGLQPSYSVTSANSRRNLAISEPKVSAITCQRRQREAKRGCSTACVR